jgi:hypothetical protein
MAAKKRRGEVRSASGRVLESVAIDSSAVVVSGDRLPTSFEAMAAQQTIFEHDLKDLKSLPKYKGSGGGKDRKAPERKFIARSRTGTTLRKPEKSRLK